jgi:hypothetical protein
MKTYKNSRGEIAATNGPVWWAVDPALPTTAEDDVTVKLNTLQPVSSLFPESPCPTAKARRVFVSALREELANVTPQDDAERDILRQAWDDARSFAEAHKGDIVGIGSPVFSCKLRLVGAADVVLSAEDGTRYTYCYAPASDTWRGEMNAIVRILHNGFPIECADDPHGTFTLANLTRATNAIVTREDTEWYRRWSAEQPF